MISNEPRKRTAPARSVELPDNVSIRASLAEIYRSLSPERHRQFFKLLVLMLLGGAAELATIGSLLPFLSLLADPSALAQLPWPANQIAAAPWPMNAVVSAAALFAIFAVAAGLLRLQLTWAIQDFGFRVGHELVVEIQRRILLQPYSFHIESNTSTLLSAIEKVEMLVFEVFLPAMRALIAAFLSVVIIAALLYIDPLTALAAAAAFSFVYALVSILAKRRLAENSRAIGASYSERLKVAQESLGGIRDVIIDGSHEVYLERFERVDRKLSLARADTAFLAAAPRYAVEAIGMVIVAAVAVILSQRDGSLASAIPVLGAVALGAQRLLPLVQQIYVGWSTASGQRAVLGQIVKLLNLPVAEQPRKGPSPLPLRDRITLENISFTYPARQGRTLEDVSLQIPRGSSLALIGPTGSGKSTLADLLMGLLEPDEGSICVDGVQLTRKNRRRWQQSIAHVPQSIFLADASIEENIALGAAGEPVDSKRLIGAAKKAQLHEFVASLPDGYATLIGERGIRLSGGQRQRLGIARAIYKQAPLLVFDEATSALDEATELAVIEALDRLGDEGRTIIVIAHRASTIGHCDMVARLHKGRLVEFGPASGESASRFRL